MSLPSGLVEDHRKTETRKTHRKILNLGRSRRVAMSKEDPSKEFLSPEAIVCRLYQRKLPYRTVFAGET